MLTVESGPVYRALSSRHRRGELYDTWVDPAELHNRAEDVALAGVRERLVAWMRETADPLAGAL